MSTAQLERRATWGRKRSTKGWERLSVTHCQINSIFSPFCSWRRWIGCSVFHLILSLSLSVSPCLRKYCAHTKSSVPTLWTLLWLRLICMIVKNIVVPSYLRKYLAFKVIKRHIHDFFSFFFSRFKPSLGANRLCAESHRQHWVNRPRHAGCAENDKNKRIVPYWTF